jgi:hypothetical protein
MDQTMQLSAAWGKGTLIGFRFFFVYFMLYIIPFPLSLVPGVAEAFGPLTELTLKFFEFLARTIVTQDYKMPSPNGSGDTTINYVQLFVFVIVSSLATIVWSVVGRKRSNHEKLLQGLWILMRYY